VVEKQRVFLFCSKFINFGDIMSTPNVPLVPIATLSLNGWVKSGSAKADYALAYFFSVNYSQTNLYRGQIASLQWLVFRYGQDPNNLSSQIQTTLTKYLQHCYPEGVYVTCSNNADSLTNPNNTYTLQLVIEIVEGGVTKSLGRLVNYQGSKVVSIINMNNTGSATSAT
jgi:hypothetical protein